MTSSAKREWPYRAWELRKRADNTLVGRLTACEPDFPFILCEFESTPAFEEYKPLFDEELALTDNLDDNWDRFDEIFNILNRELVLFPGEDGEAASEFILHINTAEGRGSFRVIFESDK
jgi:hypothetical protein